MIKLFKNLPFQVFFGIGGLKRRFPTGGSANGTLKKDRTRLWRKIDSKPRILPELVCIIIGIFESCEKVLFLFA